MSFNGPAAANLAGAVVGADALSSPGQLHVRRESLAVVADASTAPSSSTTASTTVDQGQSKSVIPRPNSGLAPENSGDRGGSAQLALLGLLLLAIATVATVVARSTMRTTRSRAPRPPSSST
jgi:hypothetical protein